MIGAHTLLALFESLPDVVFFYKDRDSRYVLANRTLLQRLGLKEMRDLIGKTAEDVFPGQLGKRYLDQDQEVLSSGREIVDVLERHIFRNHVPGWCLTRKFPVVEGQTVTGLVGISRDVGSPSDIDPMFVRISKTLEAIKNQPEHNWRIAEIAVGAGMSVAQLERYFAKLFQLTPIQWITSLRLERAISLIHSDMSISDIAHECGFSDHSAFSRTFLRHVGLSPRDYRKIARRSGQV